MLNSQKITTLRTKVLEAIRVKARKRLIIPKSYSKLLLYYIGIKQELRSNGSLLKLEPRLSISQAESSNRPSRDYLYS